MVDLPSLRESTRGEFGKGLSGACHSLPLDGGLTYDSGLFFRATLSGKMTSQ